MNLTFLLKGDLCKEKRDLSKSHLLASQVLVAEYSWLEMVNQCRERKREGERERERREEGGKDGRMEEGRKERKERKTKDSYKSLYKIRFISKPFHFVLTFIFKI